MTKRKLTAVVVILLAIICVLSGVSTLSAPKAYAIDVAETPIVITEGQYDAFTDSDFHIAGGNYQNTLYRSKSNIMKF